MCCGFCLYIQTYYLTVWQKVCPTGQLLIQILFIFSRIPEIRQKF